MRYIFYFGTAKNSPFAIWPDLFSRYRSMKIPQYTKYSKISMPCPARKSLAKIIKKEFLTDAH